VVIGLPAEALAKEGDWWSGDWFTRQSRSEGGEAKDSNLPKKRRIQLKMGSVCNFKSPCGVQIRKLD